MGEAISGPQEGRQGRATGEEAGSAALRRALLQEEGASGSFRLGAGGRETVYIRRLRSATFTGSSDAL